MMIRAYLRASTIEQDALRAKEEIKSFASERGFKIASYYVENESGASLQRPELFKLIDDSEEGDVLLIEQVDRLSRLNAEDWDTLKKRLANKRIKVVALDLPTSWMMLEASVTGDDITSRMMDALNTMMLDMLAAIARKDYTDRRRRQAQGIAKAQAEGRYKGRPVAAERNAQLTEMLKAKVSWSTIIAQTGCSRSTLSKLSASLRGK